MFEAMVEWMGHPLYYTHFGGKAPKRSGPDHATIVPYGRFRAGDGRHVMFGIQNEREWAAFCKGVLLRPGLAIDARYDNNTKRTAARAEIVALIESVFADLTADDVVARLDASGIANGRLNTPGDVWDHVQLKARNRWREVETPAGTIPAILPPASFDGVEARMDPVPAIGEHTSKILAELGYGEADVAELRDGGAV
jgi:itaconate CoA-transferase